MRIIAGTKKGAKIEALEGNSVRPTSDRVKENIFNIIQFDILDNTCLDLFGGSGSVGLECLSRGAKECVIVDINAKCIDIIKKNAAKVRLEPIVICKDYEGYVKTCNQAFDLVFLDPPYEQGMGKRAIELLLFHNCLTSGAKVVLEMSVNEEVSDFSGLTIIKNTNYGKTRVVIYFFEKAGA